MFLWLDLFSRCGQEPIETKSISNLKFRILLQAKKCRNPRVEPHELVSNPKSLISDRCDVC